MDLDSCYFCGTVDDLDRYAVVPGRFDPTPDEQRAVVLCPTCFRKIRTVIEPLADRIDDGRRSAGDGTTPDDGPGDPAGTERTEQSPDPDDTDQPAPSREPSGVSAERRAAREAMQPAGDKPEGYRRLLRLLENRSFPMRRGEIRDLAGNAYGMDADRVEASLDAAVEAGRFRPDEEEPDLLYRA